MGEEKLGPQIDDLSIPESLNHNIFSNSSIKFCISNKPLSDAAGLDNPLSSGGRA